MAMALFGAGCFWGVEAAFRRMSGITSTAAGYSGGNVDRPTYEGVCSGTTGHAEVVLVEYNPARITYRELLDLFWSIHNPSRRFPQEHRGQYRSAIFYFDEEQAAEARASRHRLQSSGRYEQEIATEIDPATQFWRAEECHQQYEAKRRRHLGGRH